MRQRLEPVEVRTDQQSAIRASRAGIQPVEISRGVNNHGIPRGRIQSLFAGGRRASAVKETCGRCAAGLQ